MNLQRLSALSLSLLLTAGAFSLNGCGGKSDSGGVASVSAPTSPAAKTTEAASPSTPSAPVETSQAGNEIAEVKARIQQMQNVKNPGEVADFFSNETAAFFSVILMIPIQMGIEMGSAFSKMGEQMGGQTKGPSADELKKIKDEMDAINKKYNVDLKAAQSGLPKELLANGRAYLKEMAALLEKMPGENGKKSALEVAKQNDTLKDLERTKFTVLEPGKRVGMEPPSDAKNEKMEAIFEDGQWRLHIPELSKGLSGGGNAMGR